MSEVVLRKRLLTVASAFIAHVGGAGCEYFGLVAHLILRWTDETAGLAKISFKNPRTEAERKIIDEIRNSSEQNAATKKFVGRFFFCREIYVSDTKDGEKNWKIIQELTHQEIINIAESALVLGTALDDKLSKK
ncbi:MAG: hypothetical protein AAB575_04055 [Patescibacteria group bacterium]